jgi:alkyldihydroxyacetonephosphate synthase
MTRPVVSLDLGRMRQVIDIDEESGRARIQAGAQGPDLEEQLGAQGWVLGHYPDSFTHSTLGGWVATRSFGMQSDKYGDISDIARGMRVVMPGKVLQVRPLPHTSTAPGVREMVLGSEGRPGVITEVTVQVHRIPEVPVILGYLFPSWESGLAAMQEISTSDAHPSITQVSDGRETAFSFATRKKSSGISISSLISKGLMKVHQRRCWNLDEVCLSFIGYEGGKAQWPGRRRSSRTSWASTAGCWSGRARARCTTRRSLIRPISVTSCLIAERHLRFQARRRRSARAVRAAQECNPAGVR